ncbi:hypothetical protein J4Q44_G00279430 [Coregonus suidteri]|uniref:Uncharacterized protein n=1 Tax=Coregonus suidteri TaxID=861788 RepID=A0AAN8L5D4_9TELE
MAIDHDYCSASDPSALGQNEDLREEMQRSRTQVEELSVRKHFCLERFAATADDILFYTRTFGLCGLLWGKDQKGTHSGPTVGLFFSVV